VSAEAATITSADFKDDIKVLLTIAASNVSSVPEELRPLLPTLELKGAVSFRTKAVGVRVQQIAGGNIDYSNLNSKCKASRPRPLKIVREVGMVDSVEYTFENSDGRTLTAVDFASTGVSTTQNGAIVRERVCYAIGSCTIVLAPPSGAAHAVAALLETKAPDAKVVDGLVAFGADWTERHEASQVGAAALAFAERRPEITRFTPAGLKADPDAKRIVNEFKSEAVWNRTPK
jgi:hypothetical protein